MKCKAFVSGALILALGSGAFAQAAPPGPEAQMRDTILRATPAELSIETESPVWGVVTDMGAARATVTVVTLVDGTTSLYFSTGGGVLGGGEHAEIAAAAQRVIRQAIPQLQGAKPETEFPLPAPQQIHFRLLTADGVRGIEAPAQALAGGSHALSPLYMAVQDVITKLRLQSEAQAASR
jgi:hypothetical protein